MSTNEEEMFIDWSDAGNPDDVDVAWASHSEGPHGRADECGGTMTSGSPGERPGSPDEEEMMFDWSDTGSPDDVDAEWASRSQGPHRRAGECEGTMPSGSPGERPGSHDEEEMMFDWSDTGNPDDADAELASPSCTLSEDVVLNSLSQDGPQKTNGPPTSRMISSVITNLETQGPDYLSRVGPKYLEDEVFMLDAVHKVPHALAMQKGVLYYASKVLRAQKDFIANSVGYRGRELEYASEDLQDDEEIVSLAVAQDGNSLKYASARLQGVQTIAKRAIDNAPGAIRFVPRGLREKLQPELFQTPEGRLSADGGNFTSGGETDDTQAQRRPVEAELEMNTRGNRDKKLPKILMSVRFDFVPSASAIPTAVHEELCNHAYFRNQFYLYDPNLVSKGFCGPKRLITSRYWPCRGRCAQISSCKFPCLPMCKCITGKPGDASCWRRSYRWQQQDTFETGGFMFQIEELATSVSSVSQIGEGISFQLGRGQLIENSMAEAIGLKVYRVQLPSVAFASVAVAFLAEKLQAEAIHTDAKYMLETISMRDLLPFCARHRCNLREGLQVARSWAGNAFEAFCVELLLLHTHLVQNVAVALLGEVEEPLVGAIEDAFWYMKAHASARQNDLERQHGKLAERVYPSLYQLQLAAEKHVTSTDSLLSHGLVHFSAAEDLEHVLTLLLSHRADAQERRFDMKGFTPLHAAAKYDNANALRALLDANAEANVKTFSVAVSPLHTAADNGALQASRLLLQQRAEVNAKDSTGATPLHNASTYDCYDVAKLLLEYRASANERDTDGYTPWQGASFQAGTSRTRDFIQRYVLEAGLAQV